MPGTLDRVTAGPQSWPVVLERLWKRIVGGATPEAPKLGPLPEGYEARRREAEALHAEGRTAEAVRVLEILAGDLAGDGNFPLAVAVRHQIHAWLPAGSQQASPDDDGRQLAARRDQSATYASPAASDPARLRKLAGQAPFLSELSAAEVTGLIESTGLVAYPAGSPLVREGEEGDRLYLVTRGVLRVETTGADGHAVPVGTLTVGDFFGEVSVLTGRPRSATVSADTDAECLQIDRTRWEELASAHPRLREMLERAISERARLTAEAVVDDFRRRREPSPAGEPG